MKKRICFIAQFPPPIHGLSKAVDTLFHSKIKDEFVFDKVNITNNKNFLKNLLAISRSKADLFYFTISQTRGGNLRDLLILKLLRMQHKKCLVHLHGGYYRHLVEEEMAGWQRKANYRAVRQLEGVIVLGKSLRTIFKGMIPDDKIYVVPNCVDDEYLLTKEELDKKINLFDEKKIKHVLYLSNFIRTKGYPEVLKMAEIEKEHVKKGGEKRFHFDFAGNFFDKNEEDFFFTYIKDHGLESFVTYHGVVGGSKKKELLKLCDIFVLLTRYPNEGQPISILEAMGNGMTVITTDHAGIPDIVEDGINGLVLKHGDKIPDLRLLQNCKSIMKNNYERVSLNYTQEKYIKKMKELFRIVS